MKRKYVVTTTARKDIFRVARKFGPFSFYVTHCGTYNISPTVIEIKASAIQKLEDKGLIGRVVVEFEL